MREKAKKIWGSEIFRTWAIIMIIFLIAFILRVVYPISRPVVWSDRAYHFINAVAEGDWIRTYQRYHPGVTIMWLVGTALRLFSNANGGLTPDQMLGVAPTAPGTLADALQVSVIPVSLVIAACIALTYPLLKRLSGHRIALVGAMFLALDPFYIGYSKVIHPDALLATFMLLSALFLLVYLKDRHWSMLIASGIFAGLSFLSKSPSIFLVPYAGLVVATTMLAARFGDDAEGQRPSWGQSLWFATRTLLLWGALAAVIFVILWPSMWVRPLETLKIMYQQALWHQNTPHPNPIFFLGRTWHTDPGIGYYLATILFKSTAVTLPFALVGVLFAIIRVKSPKSWPLWAFITYVFFFLIQMSLGQYKQIAYVLPVFPTFDLIAAYGLVWSAETIGQANIFRRFRHLDQVLIGAFLLGQLALTLTSYPYFGASNNLLLGGTRVAQEVLPQQDNGEGLEKAARFLNSLPHGQDETAQLFPRSAIVFQREYAGRTANEISPFARYHIYYLNQVMRELGDEEWHEQWEEDKKREPLYTVDVGGITQVWVYGEPPEDPAAGGPSYELGYQVGDHIQLERARLKTDRVEAGQPITLVLYWTSDGKIGRDLTVFTHVLSDDGQLVAQQDNVPLFGVRPTYTWRAGEELEDPYSILTPADLPAGQYTLTAGVYDSETLERLPLLDSDGNRLPDDRAIITTVEVVAPAAED